MRGKRSQNKIGGAEAARTARLEGIEAERARRGERDAMAAKARREARLMGIKKERARRAGRDAEKAEAEDDPLSAYYDEQARVFPQELRSVGANALQKMDAKRLEARSYVETFYTKKESGKSVIEWRPLLSGDDPWQQRTLRHWVTEPSAYLKLRLQALVGTGLELKLVLQKLGDYNLVYRRLAEEEDHGILREELREAFEMNGEPISDETSNLLMMLADRADRAGHRYVTWREFIDFMDMLQRAQYKSEEFAAELPQPLMEWLLADHATREEAETERRA